MLKYKRDETARYANICLKDSKLDFALSRNLPLNLIRYKCATHRYTSLVRRNFLRFGKRSGTFPPLHSSLEGERGGEGEDGEELPFEERLEEEGEEGQQEPFSRFPAHYNVVEEAQPAEKRARNFIRFGRAHLGSDGRAGEQMKVGDFKADLLWNLILKNSGRSREEGWRNTATNVKFSPVNSNIFCWKWNPNFYQSP